MSIVRHLKLSFHKMNGMLVAVITVRLQTPICLEKKSVIVAICCQDTVTEEKLFLTSRTSTKHAWFDDKYANIVKTNYYLPKIEIIEIV